MTPSTPPAAPSIVRTSGEATLTDLQARLQRLEDERDVRRLTTQMATLADARRWEELAEVFTPTAHADWSALSGVPAADVPARDLVQAWHNGLSGLTCTQHLLGNQDVTVDGNQARASAYVHAAHRLASAYAGPVWVVAGSYTYDLVRTPDSWRITAVTFRPTWGWGNQQVMTAAAAAASAAEQP